MAVFRAVLLLLLLAAGGLFAIYAFTGQASYRKWGLLLVKWTLIAAFGFFAVLIAERLA